VAVRRRGRVPDPTDSTVRKLFGSQSACAHPDCVRPLIDEDARGNRTIVVDVAHIIPASADGPRPWKEREYSDEYVRGYDNLLLLCKEHHKVVDEHWEDYPAHLLRKWKVDSEVGTPTVTLVGNEVAAVIRSLGDYMQLLADTTPLAHTSLAAHSMVSLDPPEPPPHFSARTHELAMICEHMRRANSLVVLFGLPGVGKSSVAAAAAHAIGEELGLDVTWISGDVGEPALMTELMCLAFGVPFRSMSLGNSAALVRAATTDRNRLVVLDGFNDEGLMDHALSLIGSGNRVLVSTAVARPAPAARRGAKQVAIQPLEPSDAIAVMLRILDHDAESIPTAWLEQIVDAAHGMPLALELITEELRSIIETTPEEFVPASLTVALQWSAGDASLGILRKIVDGLDASERAAFEALGVLATRTVPYELVLNLSSNYVESSPEFIAKLRRMLLIGRSDSAQRLTMHSVTLGLARSMLEASETGRSRARSVYTRLLADSLRATGGYEWNVANYGGLVPYELEILAWLDLLDAETVATKSYQAWQELAWVTFQLSWFLHWRGLFDTRRKYCARVVKSAPSIDDLDRNDRSLVGNLAVDLGWTLLRGGDIEAAGAQALTGLAMLRSSPDHFFAQELQAQCALLSGQSDQSLSIFESVVSGLTPGTRSWFVISMRLYLAKTEARAHDCEAFLANLTHMAEQVGLSADASTKDVAACLAYHRAVERLVGGSELEAVALAEESVALYATSGKRSAARVLAMALLARSSFVPEAARAEYRDNAETLAREIRIESPFGDDGSMVWLDMVG